nr:hypothetical protein [Nocardia arthritidis]
MSNIGQVSVPGGAGGVFEFRESRLHVIHLAVPGVMFRSVRLRRLAFPFDVQRGDFALDIGDTLLDLLADSSSLLD